MYHPGCHCSRCAHETKSRRLKGIPLEAGCGVYLCLTQGPLQGTLPLRVTGEGEGEDSHSGGIWKES